jgi:hypothetical protein
LYSRKPGRPEQDTKNRTAKIGLQEHDSQNGTARPGHPEQDSQNRTAQQDPQKQKYKKYNSHEQHNIQAVVGKLLLKSS